MTVMPGRKSLVEMGISSASFAKVLSPLSIVARKNRLWTYPAAKIPA